MIVIADGAGLGHPSRRERPRSMRTGLLIVDVLSDFDHKDGRRLAEALTQAAPALESALDRARSAGLLGTTSRTRTPWGMTREPRTLRTLV